MEWLTEQGNYIRYRGGDSSCGLSKNTLAGGIVGRMIDAGIKHRTVKDVTLKIAAIESSFKAAVYFKDGAGAGITDEQSLKAALLRYCPHYFELVGIMGERPSVRLYVDNNGEIPNAGDAPDNRDSSNGSDRSSARECMPKSKRKRPTSTHNGRERLEEKLEEIQQHCDAECRRQHEESLSFRREKLATNAAIAHSTYELYKAREDRETQKDVVNMRILLAQAAKAELESKVAILKARKELSDMGVSQADIDSSIPLNKPTTPE